MKPSHIILVLIAIFSFLGLASKSTLAKSDDKTKTEVYLAPKQGKVWLAYCYEPGKGCGEKAANTWCKDKGFKSAKHWEVQHQDKGKVRATRYIGSDGTCKSHGCDAFSSITCGMGPPTFF